LGEVLEQLKSERPLILRDRIVEEIMGEALGALSGATHVEFNGECSPGEIDRVAREGRAGGSRGRLARRTRTRSLASAAGRRWTQRRR
jgi:glycerol dehydrogenase-like iron-containing ADH family enzyme